VLFLNVELKLDTTWDSGSDSELRRYQRVVKAYQFTNNSRHPAIYHIPSLAISVAMPKDNVPRL
jgi:hypothetical protein